MNMDKNKLADGEFNFPDYPLGNGKKVSEIYNLQLDSNVSDSKFLKPWVVKDGYVTVFGLTQSKNFDETWPEGSNAVLLGPLAGGLPRGNISQTISVSSEDNFTLLFHSRVTIEDKDGPGPCLTANLEVSVDNQVLKIITCGTKWKQDYVIINVPQEKSSMIVSFRDVSENIPKADCVAAIASLKMINFPVKGATLVKISGDEQFAYLNENFKDKIIVEIMDSEHKPIPSIPINFEVTSGKAHLNETETTSATVISDPSSGFAAVQVNASATGFIKITVSLPGVQSVTFDLFVGKLRGDVSITSEPAPVTVRPLKAGSESTSLFVRSASQPIIVMPYFVITEAELLGPYSFNEKEVITRKTPLGKADISGKIPLPKIYSKQTSPVENDLHVSFDGGSVSLPVLCRH